MVKVVVVVVVVAVALESWSSMSMNSAPSPPHPPASSGEARGKLRAYDMQAGRWPGKRPASFR